MADERADIVVPVEQQIVPFHDREIIAVRLPDGRIAAVLNTLCDAVGLERTGQLVRIRDDDLLAEQLLQARIETAGGPQAMNVLTAWAIPTWLQGVRVSRVAAEKREAILAFKREAADVLYRHFAQRPALPAPGDLVSAEPVQEPARPGPESSIDEWRAWRQAMRAWMDWMDEIDRWRERTAARVETQGQHLAELQGRMEEVEAISRLVPELIERVGPPTLSPEHQHTVQRAVKRLHELTGRPYPTLYAGLCDAFRVARYYQLPEARWAEVAAWLRERIVRAGGGHSQAPEQGMLL